MLAVLPVSLTPDSLAQAGIIVTAVTEVCGVTHYSLELPEGTRGPRAAHGRDVYVLPGGWTLLVRDGEPGTVVSLTRPSAALHEAPCAHGAE